MVDIKTKCCGEVICSGETAIDALINGVQAGVSLKYADLSEVDFGKVPLDILSQIWFTSGMIMKYTITYSLDESEVRDD